MGRIDYCQGENFPRTVLLCRYCSGRFCSIQNTRCDHGNGISY